jgi:hypothetical protein
MMREPDCRSGQRRDAHPGTIAITFKRNNMSHAPQIVKPLNEPLWAHGGVDSNHESALEVIRWRSFLLPGKSIFPLGTWEKLGQFSPITNCAVNTQVELGIEGRLLHEPLPALKALFRAHARPRLACSRQYM